MLGFVGAAGGFANHQLNFTPGIDIGAALNAASLAATQQFGPQSSAGTGSVQAQGAQLILPPGLFYTSVPITLYNKVSLRGAGKRTTILMANTSFPIVSSTITFSNGSQNVGWPAHGLPTGQRVYFTNSGGALPTNFAANVAYYIVAVPNANTIQVSATRTGAAITAGSAGSGTQTGFAYTPVVSLGPNTVGSGAVFDVYVQDMWIHGGAIAATQGIKTLNGNEGCGARSVIVSDIAEIGIYCSGPNWGNCIFEDLEVGGFNPPANYCMAIETNQCIVKKATFTGAGASTVAGLYLDSAGIVGEGLHFETSVNGLDAGVNCYGVVNGVSDGGLADVTNIVHFNTTGAPMLTVNGINKNSSTNTFYDEFIGITLTDPFVNSTASFQCASSNYQDAPVTPGGSPWTYKNSTKSAIMVSLQGGTVSSITMQRWNGNINIGCTTNCCFVMQPRDTIIMTYTGAPAMNIWPMSP